VWFQTTFYKYRMNLQNTERRRMMKNKGFTLTEILIVLVVAGILLALILPNTLKAIDRGNRTADASNVKTLQTAVFMCYTDKKNWDLCDSQEELLNGKFIEEEVTSPFEGQSYTFVVKNSAQDGIGIKVCSTLDPECE